MTSSVIHDTFTIERSYPATPSRVFAAFASTEAKNIDARISVSVATIEFSKKADGTRLTWTEQGTYLDGIDGPEAPSLRQEGTTEMLDGLGRYLALPDTP